MIVGNWHAPHSMCVTDSSSPTSFAACLCLHMSRFYVRLVCHSESTSPLAYAMLLRNVMVNGWYGAGLSSFSSETSFIAELEFVHR